MVQVLDLNVLQEPIRVCQIFMDITFYHPNALSPIDPPRQNAHCSNIADGSDMCTINNGNDIAFSKNIGESSYNGDHTVWSHLA